MEYITVYVKTISFFPDVVLNTTFPILNSNADKIEPFERQSIKLMHCSIFYVNQHILKDMSASPLFSISSIVATNDIGTQIPKLF